MTNNTEKSILSDFSDSPKRNNLPPKHVRIQTDECLKVIVPD